MKCAVDLKNQVDHHCFQAKKRKRTKNFFSYNYMFFETFYVSFTLN